MIEISIKVKDEKSSLTEKDFVPLEYYLSKDNSDLQSRVNDVYNKFKSTGDVESPEIVVKAKMVWQP